MWLNKYKQQQQQQMCYKHAASSLYSFDRILVNEVSIAFILLFEHWKWSCDMQCWEAQNWLIYDASCLGTYFNR